MPRGCEVHVSTDVVTGAPLLRVIGEVDAATADIFQDALSSVIPNDGTTVVVDLSDVDFMSAAGLRILLDANSRWVASGRSLVLRTPSSGVLLVLRAAGVEHLFEIDFGDATTTPGR
jgi:anti-sigma B factor antagonist